MARHSAVAREDALRREEAVDVVRRGLGTDEDDFLALAAALGRLVGVEYYFTDGSARRGGQPLDEDVTLGFRVELRVEQLLDLLGGDARNGGLRVNEASWSISMAILTAAAAVRFPFLVWRM